MVIDPFEFNVLFTAIRSQNFNEGMKIETIFHTVATPLAYDRTRAMDVMFDEEVLLPLIAAEHHTINHKLDLRFVVVPFVTSSEKFHISSIWNIVYTNIVVWWCISIGIDPIHIKSNYRLPFVQIMIWHTVHLSSFNVHPIRMFGYWRCEQWTINHGQCDLESHFLKMSVTLLNMKRIRFFQMYANFKSHFICDLWYSILCLGRLILIYRLSSFQYHKIWPTYLCIYVFIMIDHVNAIKSILKSFTYRQSQFRFVVRSIKRFHFIWWVFILDHPLTFNFGNSISLCKSIVILDKQIYKCTMNVFRLVRSDNFQKSVQNTILKG